ncbi:hypothetical protein [Desulfogranum marinum]|uniref:hypothetical protein n=1 Tax=Desulfogranum marinum TaxID=453220 RepID=UPI001963AB33|nr:hypothetical protein [Desulfogranum marinum]MBM9515276.1 hypothetical protein [Desulfogranum marinum]
MAKENGDLTPTDIVNIHKASGGVAIITKIMTEIETSRDCQGQECFLTTPDLGKLLDLQSFLGEYIADCVFH